MLLASMSSTRRNFVARSGFFGALAGAVPVLGSDAPVQSKPTPAQSSGKPAQAKLPQCRGPRLRTTRPLSI